MIKKLATLTALVCGMLALASPSWSKDWKEVTVAIDATYPPFQSIDSSGKFVGFEMEYGDAMCKQMNLICHYQNVAWEGIVPALLSGKVDIIMASMNITPERKRQILMSDMYYMPSYVLVGQKDDPSSSVSQDGLKGTSIGAVAATGDALYAQKYYGNLDVKLYPSYAEVQLELANGRLDYMVGSAIVIQQFLDKPAGACCRVIGQVERDPVIYGEGVGAGFRKEDTDLHAKFNAAIAALDEDGTFKTLAAKYFKFDIRGK